MTIWLILAACISGVSLLASSWWIADLIANLRIQVLIGLLPLMVLGLLARSGRITVAVLALCVWHLWFLKTAFIPVPDRDDREWTATGHSDTTAPLTVCLANVLVRNVELDRICESLRRSDADVIAIVEMSESLQAKLTREFSDDYPWFVSRTMGDSAFGIGLLSRYQLKEAEIVSFSEDWLPSITADVVMPSHSVRIFVTHPTTPMSPASFTIRNRHLMSLVGSVNQLLVSQPDRPVLIVGDMNLTPWTSLYQELLRESGLSDASAGRGLTPTWYAAAGFPFGLVLDHAWYSPALECRDRTILPDIGSDHRPVLLEFSLDAASETGAELPGSAVQ